MREGFGMTEMFLNLVLVLVIPMYVFVNNSCNYSYNEYILLHINYISVKLIFDTFK